MRTPLTIYFLLITVFSYAQSLEQTVIGAAGNFSANSGGSTLSWTVGEPISTTENSSSAILTQGFQQPVTVNPLSISNKIEDEIAVQVFPNPTTEQITIQTNSRTALKAELINVLGQVIHSYALNDASLTIDLTRLPAANYLLQVYSKKSSIQTFKIQKIQ